MLWALFLVAVQSARTLQAFEGGSPLDQSQWVRSYIQTVSRPCVPQCHRLAFCGSPNNCTCLPTYSGDGVARCFRPAPVVRDFGVAHSRHFSFTIEPPGNWTPTEVFCRFGPAVVRGAIANGTAAACAAPRTKGGAHECRLSFDGEEWSAPPLVVEFPADRLAVHCFVGGFASTLLAMIAATLQWMATKCGRRAAGRGREEVMPLNRWHIQGAQPSGAEENTVFRFLVHAVLT
jgi:hypothetical protein